MLIGIKDVLMDAPYNGFAGKNWFYSKYDIDNKIIGTQWLPTGNFFDKKTKKNSSYFVLLNPKDNEYTNKTIIVKSMYKHY